MYFEIAKILTHSLISFCGVYFLNTHFVYHICLSLAEQPTNHSWTSEEVNNLFYYSLLYLKSNFF